MDLMIVGQVLHSYGVDDCRRIVDICRESLKVGGRVVIPDLYLNNDGRGPLYPALFALDMIVDSKEGNSYTHDQVISVLKDAGFSDIGTKSLVGPISVVYGSKV